VSATTQRSSNASALRNSAATLAPSNGGFVPIRKSPVSKQKAVALLLALAVAVLSACGGSGDDGGGEGQVRLVNATTDYASLDFHASDSLVATAVLQDEASSFFPFTAAVTNFKLKRAGSSVTSLSTDRTVTRGVNNTLVAYTTASTLRTVYMTDDESAPSSGNARLRVFNTSSEAGSIDVYLASVGGSIDDVSALTSSLGAERFSGYTEVARGSYRVVVTGAGDKTDLRLDLPSITLADQQVTTLILTTTPGGVLLNGLLVNQASTLQAQKNPSARIRLVAGTTSNGTVAATLNGTVLSSGLRSPTVGAYTLVPAGTLTADVQVNGMAVSVGSRSAAPGADLTLMVLGTPTAPQVALLADDNRPPTAATNTRLRLVHGLNNLSGGITLTADYAAVATDLAYATASTPAAITAGTTYRLEASSPSSSLYLATDVTLQATRVYTVFVLGDASAPQGVLRRDR
jgi:hypothetical protein